ncbi:MAG: RNB domain-containing ribonuclease, partial [Chlamydiota bacterium]
IDIYPAWVRNQAKLTYPAVGTWLEQNAPALQHPLPNIPHLREQLTLQDQIAEKIQQYRNAQGALSFAEIELQAVVVDGIPVALEERIYNRAHRLIENAMIAANVGATRYLVERKLPSIRRIVRTPKKWDRIVVLAKNLGEMLPKKPDSKALRKFLLHQQAQAPLLFPDLSIAVIKLLGRGEYVLGLPGKDHLEHFDLAESEYSHTTAPNRRFPDLIMQRLLKSSLYGDLSPYTNQELSTLAAHCTQKEDDATKVERRLIKCAAAIVLSKEIGRSFSAMVTGASPKGTWVRLQKPPIEGKLIRGFEGVDVGDFIKVKLLHVDVLNGHIDFAKV